MIKSATVIALLAAAAFAQRTFVHPGVFNSRAELDYMKAAINGATAHPMKDGYSKLQEFSGASLTWTPTVYAEVNYVASGGSPSESAIRNSGHAVYAHAIQWVVTGSAAHADKAIEIMRAWATGFQRIQGAPTENQNKLETSWDIPIWVSGAEIIRHYNNGAAGWSSSDIAAFDGFMEILFTESRKLCCGGGNNWIASGCLAMMSLAVFRSDEVQLDRAINWWNTLLPVQVYQSGQLNETCRDCNHAEYGIIGMMQSAEIAWHQGEDLYAIRLNGQSTPRLAMGMEYHAAALLGRPLDASCGPQSCSGDDQHGPGWEMAYNHYTNRMGLSIPNTEEFVIQNNRPVGTSESHFPGFTTCTHADLDAAGTNRVALPKINPAGGTFTEPVSVTLTCATSNAEVYYTLDGSTPTTSSNQYTSPFTVGTDAVVRALGVESGMDNSAVAMATFDFIEIPQGCYPVQDVTASSNDGNIPENTIDDNLSTRWSADGDGQWVRWDLGVTKSVGCVWLAFYSGIARQAQFDLQVSDDGNTWTNMLTGATSSGATLELEKFQASGNGRYVRFLGHGNSGSSWNSITEALICEPGTWSAHEPIASSGTTLKPAGFRVGAKGLSISWASDGERTIELATPQGRLVHAAVTQSRSMHILGSRVPSGVYVLRIRGQGQSLRSLVRF